LIENQEIWEIPLHPPDDNFIRKAFHAKDALKITVKNPVICLMEVLKK